MIVAGKLVECQWQGNWWNDSGREIGGMTVAGKLVE
jgi:hypothetical protein